MVEDAVFGYRAAGAALLSNLSMEKGAVVRWDPDEMCIRDSPTSKQLIEPVPGAPQKINSLPMSMAISPDKRYVVTINAGFGTAESNYDQSLAVLDTQTGQITDCLLYTSRCV